MEKYNVTGMSCAACSATVEKAAKKVSGVEKCAVNLLTNSMTVEGDYDEKMLIEAIIKAGYGATRADSAEGGVAAGQENAADVETKRIKTRLIVSCVFLVVLMYCAMGHNMLGLPLPSFIESKPILIALIQLILSAIVLIINQKFFTNGFKSLIRLNPNMDTLVALGSSVSYLYSVGITFAMAADASNAHGLLHELYFESAAMILVLITVGKMLESHSKGRTTDALKSLMKLAPKTATLLIDGEEKVVSVEDVRVGDIFVVRPGESIAVDGNVIDGISSVNEPALTGESIPADKEAGDLVSSGTVNLSGFLTCRATRVGQDTTLSQIIKTVSDASATKAPIARIADKVSGIFVPTVISIALITTVVWLLLGKEIGFALVRGISVLVISCPCALGLATPVAIMVGNGVGAKNGILFKTAEALENAGKVKTVVLDKTGTITKGHPVIKNITPLSDTSEEELMIYAYSLEKKSEHPLAKAIVDYAVQNAIQSYEVEDFKIMSGSGLCAKYQNKTVYGGNKRFIESVAEVSNEAKTLAEQYAEEGKTPLFFAVGDRVIGIVAVADEIKSDSMNAISKLKALGIKTVMLTGDNEKTANAIGKQVGIDKIIAGVLPDGKERVVRDIQKSGAVAMVGDGINDAPALTVADVGIAIGAGTDIAIDSADVVLMKSNVSDVVSAIRISRATLRNIHQNLFWAFVYNAIGIPLAAGVFISLFGWKLTPMFGALAMSLSSFCVVTNALRLNFVKLPEAERTEEKGKCRTMHIKGMMCEHCENRVQTVLLSIDGVSSVKADHKKGIAIVVAEDFVDNATLINAVVAEDYKVKKII